MNKQGSIERGRAIAADVPLKMAMAYAKGFKTDRVIVGARTFDALERKLQGVDVLPRVQPMNAFVGYWGNTHLPLLYVRPGYSGYKHAYGLFSSKVYGTDLTEIGLTGMNLDHVAGQERAKQLGLNHVLLLPTSEEINQGFAAIEKTLTTPPDHQGLCYSNFLHVAKANNIPYLGKDTRTDPDGIGYFMAANLILECKDLQRYQSRLLRLAEDDVRSFSAETLAAVKIDET